MGIKEIDAKILQTAFLAGAQCIESKKEYINELNVFPVPDGDTGTNMTMTIMAAAKEVGLLENPDMKTVCKTISSGSLRGARGNSGVILSQLLRGLTKSLMEKETITTKDMAEAFEKAVETAYKAVMKPKEGTILTVAKGGAKKAAELSEQDLDFETFGEQVIAYMEETLQKTPEMLPVLKEAGVVDSGGQGLLTIIMGAYDAITGKVTDVRIPSGEVKAAVSTRKVDSSNLSTSDIKYGYCTEFIILLPENSDYNIAKENAFKQYLETIGDSLVVVSDEDVVKVHVHTNDPGLAIQKALTYGALSNMKIDNMRLEHTEKLFKEEQGSPEITPDFKQADEEMHKEANPRKDVGFISVSMGEGMDEIFQGLGVDVIIEGGQTMNPSTEDMLNAIAKVNADTIYILPNNKNIILAAGQARDLTEDKKIIVIPSTTIPQGITAMINHVVNHTPEENEAHMIEEMNKVHTGQVTYAVRDTSIDGMSIEKGNIMGIGDGKIVSVASDVASAAKEMVAYMMNDEAGLISIYYGEEVTKEDAEALCDTLSEQYPDCEVELNYGGQPIYYYVISIEP
ncbi:MAG: DAK2 domain-containing protein [Clostridiales bacterium]|nr:DAK2 domain-containing protein [Clostridiales bacterium]